ncbi:MAG: hypothetical protein ACREN5_12625 [Gemmatimonadales bacterium]
MPVTPKLSRKFYDKLGDDVANELVEWFNLFDATYRSDLKERNELNFGRARAEMEAALVRLEAKLGERIAELRGEMQAGFVRAEARLDQRLAEFETRLTKRMFYFWVAQAATTAGLVFGMVKLIGV